MMGVTTQAPAALVNSPSNLDIGLGYVAGNTWNTSETAAANTPNTDGYTPPSTSSFDLGSGFNITVTVGTTTTASSWGPRFPLRVLTDQGTPDGGYSALSTNFTFTITATYTGALPVTDISLNLTKLSIYAEVLNQSPYNTTGTNIQFNETTASHAGSSDPVTDLVITYPPYLAADYKQLVWDAADTDPLDAYQVAGSSVTRTFTITPGATDTTSRVIDGLEIFGSIQVAVPEPASLGLLVLGSAALLRRRERAVA
jgi:hypothetical protein